MGILSLWNCTSGLDNLLFQIYLNIFKKRFPDKSLPWISEENLGLWILKNSGRVESCESYYFIFTCMVGGYKMLDKIINLFYLFGDGVWDKEPC